MSRDSDEHHGTEAADGRLPLKGYRLKEDEWSPWYTDDFGLTTKISWQRASDRSIFIHNLAAPPDCPDPSCCFVHLTYEVDLTTGRKSRFEIQGVFLEGAGAEARNHVLDTLDRAVRLAEGKDPS